MLNLSSFAKRAIFLRSLLKFESEIITTLVTTGNRIQFEV